MDHWAIVPFVDCVEYTKQATLDLLAQTVPLRVLLVSQGSSKETSEELSVFVEQHHPQVLMWTYNPPLPSLSAAWNRALQFVWDLGGTEALVVNNDVRLHRQMGEVLSKTLQSTQALFVSAVGVMEGQFDPAVRYDACAGTPEGWLISSRGGPDFSCFLISKEGHQQYPFDETFIPAYGEDLDTHRRYMLGGDGARIFSVNLPFLHYASGTLKSFSPEQKAKFNLAYAKVVEHYTRLWGGKPNQETYTRKGDPTSAREGVTTPELQRRVQAGEAVLG